MTTNPREWPNKAKNARDNSAKRAMAGIRALQPILTSELPEEQIVRRAAIASMNLQYIVRMMEASGARVTDPVKDGFMKTL